MKCFGVLAVVFLISSLLSAVAGRDEPPLTASLRAVPKGEYPERHVAVTASIKNVSKKPLRFYPEACTWWLIDSAIGFISHPQVQTGKTKPGPLVELEPGATVEITQLLVKNGVPRVMIPLLNGKPYRDYDSFQRGGEGKSGYIYPFDKPGTYRIRLLLEWWAAPESQIWIRSNEIALTTTDPYPVDDSLPKRRREIENLLGAQSWRDDELILSIKGKGSLVAAKFQESEALLAFYMLYLGVADWKQEERGRWELFRWVENAAGRGPPAAFFGIGMIYLHGLDCFPRPKPCPERDWALFQAALDEGITEAKPYRDRVAKELNAKSSADAKGLRDSYREMLRSNQEKWEGEQEERLSREVIRYFIMVGDLADLHEKQWEAVGQRLAEKYHSRQELPRNKEDWIEWFEPPAAAGDMDAQWWLGLTYAGIYDGISNLEKAYQWLCLAAGKNQKTDTASTCEKVAAFLTPGQLQEARQHLNSFKPCELPAIYRQHDFSDFGTLSIEKKGAILDDFYQFHLWGKPEHKPICEDLLKTQGARKFSGGEIFYGYWVPEALELIEKNSWFGFVPLVQQIYDRPKTLDLYKSAFIHLRRAKGQPVPDTLLSAFKALLTMRRDENKDTLTKVRETILNATDKEVRFVFSVVGAGHRSSGKGGYVNNEGAVEILKTLDPEFVKPRMQHLLESLCPSDRDSLKKSVEALGLK